ncbi:MAG: HU family DNA-binding protein [Candidatus Thioglobus sp.]|jgi:DNA-binding protein HU-beta|nr:MAG: HU family DNA-binding protein [Candidatus Thioglobus sp.]
MNKADLIDAVATKTGLGKSQASSAVESFLDVISEALTRGETVSLVGFGIFSVSERAGRVGRNPRTGESITIAPSRAPKFKAGKGLKDAVN